ncbi:MAG: hypothetical protein KCHDKBKB_00303 [Elusimicrobia bacterium]|nr:hypothetical protein [Elusimicrobiota bacterium]
MKIRAELHLGDFSGKVILAAKPEEKADHLAMKLAAFTMFLPMGPIVEPSTDHPGLAGLDIRPDVCTLNEAGEIDVWIECGEVSINKLDKLARRLPETRIVVIKSDRRQALHLRERLTDEVKQGERIEIWTWLEGAFQTWLKAMEDKTELYGEAHEKSFNLVINGIPYAVDLISV